MWRSKSLTYAFHLWLWSSLTSAAPLLPFASVHRDLFNRALLPPSQDPFYQPDPSTFASQAPGTILNTRQIDTLLNSQATYQILFRSTDSLGQASAVVSTVLVPQTQSKTAGGATKLVSLQFAYDSAFVDCSPSWVLQQQGVSSSGVPLEPLLAEAALAQGWFVSIPDYEGSLAAFTNGVQAGQATLDSIRAAISPGNPAGVTENAVYSVVGGSGGALASEWALELQPTYAPDLHIAGGALGSLTPNVLNVYNTVNKGSSTGLLPPALIGISVQNPDYIRSLYQNLVPSTRASFLKAQSQCLAEDTSQFENQDINTYFIDGYQDIISDPLIEAINTLGIMGKRDGVPKGQVPVFAWKGALDEISPVADTDSLISEYCSQGARIQYERYALLNHGLASLAGIPNAFTFLSARFDSLPVGGGCETSTSLIGAFDLPAFVQTFGVSLASEFAAVFADEAGG